MGSCSAPPSSWSGDIHARAGGLVGLAALVKLTAGLALIGLLLWAWRHEPRRFALAIVAAVGAVVTAGYLAVVASASHVLASADKTVTNTSPWNGVLDRLLRHDAWRNVPNPLAANNTLVAFAYVGMATVLVLAVGMGWRATRRARPTKRSVCRSLRIRSAPSTPSRGTRPGAFPCSQPTA